MKTGAVHASGQRSVLLAATTVTAAITAATTTPVLFLSGMQYLIVQAKFLIGTGGTTLKTWVQTSVDGGVTWCDIMSFAYVNTPTRNVQAVNVFTALAAAVVPTDGTMADNTILSGLLGDRIRVKWTSTGTYSGGTSIQLDAIAKG